MFSEKDFQFIKTPITWRGVISLIKKLAGGSSGAGQVPYSLFQKIDTVENSTGYYLILQVPSEGKITSLKMSNGGAEDLGTFSVGGSVSGLFPDLTDIVPTNDGVAIPLDIDIVAGETLFFIFADSTTLENFRIDLKLLLQGGSGIAEALNNADPKSQLVDNDIFAITDSEDSFALKQILFSEIVNGVSSSLDPETKLGDILTYGEIVTGILFGSLNSTAKQEIYTIPEGKIFAPTRFLIKLRTNINLTTAIFGFGFNANADNVVAPVLHASLVSNGVYQIDIPKTGAAVGVAGDVLGLKCTTPQGETADVDIYAYGFLLNA